MKMNNHVASNKGIYHTFFWKINSGMDTIIWRIRVGNQQVVFVGSGIKDKTKSL